jgi:molybdate transport system ATP-binding protein
MSTRSEADSLLEVELGRSRFHLDVRLEWTAPTLVLFGPSGSGKTTLMRALLGLEPRAKMRLRLAGTWLEDWTRSLRVPVHSRRLGWVPQSATLFPDRNVDRNIRFGSRDPGDTPQVRRAIEVLELGDLLNRPVAGLSGGERQRVALARAIASRPRALLLDEPLASLDLDLRARVLPYLLRIRNELKLPLIHITHDPDEAILLGDEIAVLEAGRLVAQGPPRETLWSRSVLPLSTRLGVENLLDAVGIRGSGGGPSVRTRGGIELQTPWPVTPGESLTLGVRAEDVLVGLDRPGRISARNVLHGRVESLATVEEGPLQHLVHVAVGEERMVARLTESAVRDLALKPGLDVYLILKSQALRRVR